jgi:hypothetical protein
MAACPCRPRGPRGSAGNVPTGPTAFAVGVVVVRGLGGTAPRNNSVVANDFSRNKPDTFWDGSRLSATASPTTTATRASQRVCVARARVMEASLRRGFRFFRGETTSEALSSRPFVDERDLHHCSEAAGLHRSDASIAQPLAEVVAETLGFLRRRGVHESRTLAFSRAGERGELGKVTVSSVRMHARESL